MNKKIIAAVAAVAIAPFAAPPPVAHAYDCSILKEAGLDSALAEAGYSVCLDTCTSQWGTQNMQQCVDTILQDYQKQQKQRDKAANQNNPNCSGPMAQYYNCD